MTSATVLTVNVLKAAATVGAIVSDRIEPEMAPAGGLPRIVVRQAGGRQRYGLARSTALREAQVNVLCTAATYLDADNLADVVIAALKDVRHARVGDERITLRQEGEDAGTWDETGQTFTRIVGFKAAISG